MRKTVERVDIGTFGLPMKFINWTKRKKSTVGGLVSLSLGQMAVGLVFATIFGLAVGIPLNAFSISILVFYCIGCAIGGPFSFTVWTFLIIGLTTPVAGLLGDAWIASPSWWRLLADNWRAGQSIPGWFLIAVPVWVLFWVGAARGIAKVAEIIFEKLALRMGFGAAKRFMGEDQRVFDEAFKQSDVSEAETASLLETSGNGTHSLITGEPSRMGGVQMSKPIEMGGDPDISSEPLPSSDPGDPIDYSAFIEIDDKDEMVLRASGVSRSALEDISAPEEPIASAEDTSEASVDMSPKSDAQQPVAEVVEMEAINLPDIPKDPSANVQKVALPPLHHLQNRSFMRRMSQLKIAFEVHRHEDRHAEFVEKFYDELSVISDEQERILQSMEDCGPLLATIATIRAKRAEDFMAGRAPAPLVPASDNEGYDQPSDASSEHSTDTDEDLPFATDFSQPETADVISSNVEDVPEDDEVANVEILPATTPLKPTAEDEANSEAPQTDKKRLMVDILMDVENRTPNLLRENVKKDIPSENNAKAHDVAASSDRDAVVIDDPLMPEGSKEGSSDILINQGNRLLGFKVDLVDQEETPSTEKYETDAALTDTDEMIVASEVHEANDATIENADITEGEASVDAADLVSNDDDEVTQVLEESMNGVELTTILCRQVYGLVVGSPSPETKADVILQFEKANPGVSVDFVLNSRAFDEKVGSADAAAARHAWKDIKQVLAEPISKRLTDDFERVNERGKKMIEEPQTITIASFNSLSSESDALVKKASSLAQSGEFATFSKLVKDNISIRETLKGIMVERSEKAKSSFDVGTGPISRMKIPAGSSGHETPVPVVSKKTAVKILDIARSHGEDMLGQLSKEKVSVERPDHDKISESEDIETPSETYDFEDSHEVHQERVSDTKPKAMPMPFNDVTPTQAASRVIAQAMPAKPVEVAVPPATAPSEKKPGEEGFVSKHPVGSDEYIVEMDMHEAGLASRRKREEERLRLQEEEDRRQRELKKKQEEEARLIEEGRLAKEKMEEELAEEVRRQLKDHEEAYEKAREEVRIAHDKKVARIKEEKEEAELRNLQSLAKAAELKVKAEAELLSLALDAKVIVQAIKDRHGDYKVPERFKTTDIIASVMVANEMRAIRKMFMRTSSTVDVASASLSDEEKAFRYPSFRMQQQMDVEIGKEANSIIAKVVQIVDPTDSDDFDAIKALLSEDEEPFVARLKGDVDRGASAEKLIAKADIRLKEVIANSSKAEEAADLEKSYALQTKELEDLKAIVSNHQAEKDEIDTKIKQLENELVNTKAELVKIKNEALGIIDDEFQEVLDKYGQTIDAVGIPGFYAFASEDFKNLVVICTLSSKKYTEGVVNFGSKSLTLHDVVLRAIAAKSHIMQEKCTILFTDQIIKSQSNLGGLPEFTLGSTERKVDNLLRLLKNESINIDYKEES